MSHFVKADTKRTKEIGEMMLRSVSADPMNPMLFS